MKDRLPKGFIESAWDWDEVSCRNCSHSKVFAKNGTLFAYCSEGRLLSLTGKEILKKEEEEAKKFAARLSHVLCNPSHIPQACLGCLDFQHDVPVPINDY